MNDASNRRLSMLTADTGLVQLVAAIRAAKLGAAEMYSALAERMPGVDATLALRGLADDEMDHAGRLQHFVGGGPASDGIDRAALPGCGLHDESWATSLMAAFALDQAATAALVGIASLTDGALAETAASIVAEERRHQAFAIGAFRSLADADPSLGLALARDMIVARDWVKQVFPRHAALANLVAEGAPR